MARKLVTEADVFEAASELLEEGKVPSTIGIHRKLGRGSYTTIGKYLKDWEQGSGLNDTAYLQPDTHVPEAIAKDAQLFVKKLWRSAQLLGREELEEERETLSQRENELEAEIQQVVDASDAAANRIADLEKQLQSIRETHEYEVAARREVEQQLALRTAALERAEQESAKLEKKLETLSEKYETKLDTLTGRYEHKLEEVTRLDSEVTNLNTEMARLHRDLVQKHQETEQVSQKQAETAASLQEEKSKNQTLTEQARRLQRQDDEKVSALAEAQREIRKLAEDRATYLGQLQEKEQQLAQLKSKREHTKDAPANAGSS